MSTANASSPRGVRALLFSYYFCFLLCAHPPPPLIVDNRSQHYAEAIKCHEEALQLVQGAPHVSTTRLIVWLCFLWCVLFEYTTGPFFLSRDSIAVVVLSYRARSGSRGQLGLVSGK